MNFSNIASEYNYDPLYDNTHDIYNNPYTLASQFEDDELNDEYSLNTIEFNSSTQTAPAIANSSASFKYDLRNAIPKIHPTPMGLGYGDPLDLFHKISNVASNHLFESPFAKVHSIYYNENGYLTPSAAILRSPQLQPPIESPNNSIYYHDTIGNDLEATLDCSFATKPLKISIAPHIVEKLHENKQSAPKTNKFPDSRFQTLSHASTANTIDFKPIRNPLLKKPIKVTLSPRIARKIQPRANQQLSQSTSNNNIAIPVSEPRYSSFPLLPDQTPKSHLKNKVYEVGDFTPEYDSQTKELDPNYFQKAHAHSNVNILQSTQNYSQNNLETRKTPKAPEIYQGFDLSNIQYKRHKLIAKYILDNGDKLNQTDIGKQFDLTATSISNIIQKYQIPYTKKRAPGRKHKAVEIKLKDFNAFLKSDSPKTYAAIRDHFKCSRRSLNKFMKDHWIKPSQINPELPKRPIRAHKLKKAVLKEIKKFKDSKTMKFVAERFNITEDFIKRLSAKNNIVWTRNKKQAI